jgi:hypothetical protein
MSLDRGKGGLRKITETGLFDYSCAGSRLEQDRRRCWGIQIESGLVIDKHYYRREEMNGLLVDLP